LPSFLIGPISITPTAPAFDFSGAVRTIDNRAVSKQPGLKAAGAVLVKASLDQKPHSQREVPNEDFPFSLHSQASGHEAPPSQAVLPQGGWSQLVPHPLMQSLSFPPASTTCGVTTTSPTATKPIPKAHTTEESHMRMSFMFRLLLKKRYH
jgi:hypothetical protein